LQSLYESIKTEPFKIPEDDGNDLMHTFFNPDKEGWLWKQGEFHFGKFQLCHSAAGDDELLTAQTHAQYQWSPRRIRAVYELALGQAFV
jgi:hypothetical protein